MEVNNQLTNIHVAGNHVNQLYHYQNLDDYKKAWFISIIKTSCFMIKSRELSQALNNSTNYILNEERGAFFKKRQDRYYYKILFV
jgi:hypothetical protein